MLQKSPQMGSSPSLQAILSSLGWKGSFPAETWHLPHGQPATIINSALGCATQVSFYLEVSRTAGFLAMASVITLAGLWGQVYTDASEQVSTNPTRTTLPEKEPPLGLRDDRSVFGVACREIHYLPVIHQ